MSTERTTDVPQPGDNSIKWPHITPDGMKLIEATASRAYNSIAGKYGAAEIPLPPISAHKTRPATRYKLKSALDVMSSQPIGWLIKGVMPEKGLAAVYGPSGSGKSFIVLDMAASIAKGEQWFGYRTKKRVVVYVCLEGVAGISLRLRALGKSVPANLHFLTSPVNMTTAKDLTDLVEACAGAGADGGVVVIDTLNMATPGVDENSSTDMGKSIAAANAIQRGLGGLVLLVHHTGKDASKGLRGHSSLFAALDAAIEVRRDGEARSFALAKAKDGADGHVQHFTLDVVNLGIDEDGDPITSCRVRPVDRVVKTKALSPGQQLGMDAFMAAAAQHIGKGDPTVHANLEDWRAEFLRRSTAETPAGRRSLFSRTRRELVELGRLTVSDNVYKLPGSAASNFDSVWRVSESSASHERV